VKSRVLTAIGLIPFVLGAFFCASPWPILLLAWIAVIQCSRELSALLKQSGVLFGLLFTADILLPPLRFYSTLPFELLISIGCVICGIWATYSCTKRIGKLQIGTLFASYWFVGPIYCLTGLHEMTRSGQPWVFANPALMAVVPLWGGDTAAIFVGKAFGRHPLAPKLSPKKTVEGSIANLLACTLVSIPLGMWIGYAWWVSLICGLCAGTFGQLGDLFESFVKRQVGVKDSGNLLPGHGGLLDRIDSILFTAPVVYVVLLLVSPSARPF